MTAPDPAEARVREVVDEGLARLLCKEDWPNTDWDKLGPGHWQRRYLTLARIAREYHSRALLAERRAGMGQCEAIAVDYLDRMLGSAAKPHPITGQYPNGIAECKADAAQTILDRIRALASAAGKEQT